MNRIVLISLALVIILWSQTLGRATVGPVKLDFGRWYKTIGSSRVNAANNFVVSFVYTKNIKIHDWVKVWLPLDENMSYQTKEQLEKNFCDGLPKITGGLESPRFVPNKAYFEKYPDSPEKEIGKLYRASGEHMHEVSFIDLEDEKSDNRDACHLDSSSPKLISDSSGLGYWMLGTVLPALPRDVEKRIEFMKKIRYHINIGYPCACLTINYHINSNCKERSISVNNPFELEPWRKGYNVADVNVTKDIGIVFPATPGRYRVAVATRPEPVPVESESFILPCSDVSNVVCNATEFGFSTKNPFTVSFRTGEGGALDNKYSTIFVKLPEQFSISPKFSKRLIKVNGTRLESDPEITKIDGQTVVKLVSPVDVNNSSKVDVVFDIFTHTTYNPDEKDCFVEVSTSSEPNFVKSQALLKLKETSLAIQPPEEYRESTISIRLLLDNGKTYPPQTPLKIILPEAFAHGEKITNNDILINGVHPATNPKISGNTIEMSAPSDIKNKLVVALLQNCAIVNPSVGFYLVKLEIGSDRYSFDDIYIQPAKARIGNLVMSSKKPNTYANVTFDFQPSSFGNLDLGDEISLQFPQSFILPKSLDRKWITVDKAKVENAKVEGTRLIFKSPVKQVVSGKYKYVISIGMRLPQYLTGSELMCLSTSKGDNIDESLGTEEAYSEDDN
ncbi:MAG: hypothetical protein KA140_05625 [Caldisericia bacterium]|nr:hypothetical protein [Caldisericia bacterium]